MKQYKMSYFIKDNAIINMIKIEHVAVKMGSIFLSYLVITGKQPYISKSETFNRILSVYCKVMARTR